MTRARRLLAASLLAAAAGTLPGCFFVRTCIPLDASGMEFPRQWASDTVADQVERTSATIRDLPSDLAAHTRGRWHDLTTYPGE